MTAPAPTDRQPIPAASILRCIESGAPQDVTGLASALGLHPNTVRKHLRHLLRARLVVEEDDRSGRAGRPRRLYRPAPPPDSDMIALARRLGRSTGAAEAADAAGATDAVVAITAAHGLIPTVVGDEVVIERCGFADEPLGAPVCALHIGLAEGAAAAHGARVRLAVDAGARTCRFRLTEVDAGLA